MKSIAAVCVLLLAVALPVAGQPILDLEDLNKTMVAFERAFETKSPDALRAISHESMLKARYFDTLVASMDSCRVSSAYSTRVARQEFDVNGAHLAVDFSYRDGEWFVENATVNNRSLAPRGFAALASEYHFSDFRAALLGGKIQQYAGVRFNAGLAKKPFTPKADTTVTILNILLHDGKAPRELLYLKLRKFPEVLEQRRGWLIESAGPMLNYARQRNTGDPLIEFLANRDSYFDLEKPSAFAFVNVREPAVPQKMAKPKKKAAPEPELNLKAGIDNAATHTMKRVATRDFAWNQEGTSFTLSIELAGDATRIAEWKSSVVGNALRLETSPNVVLAKESVPHPYLEIHAEQNALVIGIRRGADAPIPNLARARVHELAVSGDGASTRVTANILIEKN